MSSTANLSVITRNRRRYNSNMNLGEVLDCIQDIIEELKRDHWDSPDC